MTHLTQRTGAQGRTALDTLASPPLAKAAAEIFISIQCSITPPQTRFGDHLILINTATETPMEHLSIMRACVRLDVFLRTKRPYITPSMAISSKKG